MKTTELARETARKLICDMYGLPMPCSVIPGEEPREYQIIQYALESQAAQYQEALKVATDALERVDEIIKKLTPDGHGHCAIRNAIARIAELPI